MATLTCSKFSIGGSMQKDDGIIAMQRGQKHYVAEASISGVKVGRKVLQHMMELLRQKLEPLVDHLRVVRDDSHKLRIGMVVSSRKPTKHFRRCLKLLKTFLRKMGLMKKPIMCPIAAPLSLTI